jgi:hypothetical protein
MAWIVIKECWVAYFKWMQTFPLLDAISFNDKVQTSSSTYGCMVEVSSFLPSIELKRTYYSSIDHYCHGCIIVIFHEMLQASYVERRLVDWNKTINTFVWQSTNVKFNKNQSYQMIGFWHYIFNQN